MCSQQDKKLINHFNRTVIGLAGITGALMDGFSSGDLLCIFSMVFWLWQSECSVLEEQCIDLLKQCAAVKKNS